MALARIRNFRPKFFNESQKIAQALKDFHIRPVKNIKYTFDPFTPNVESIRNTMFCLNSKAVRRTSVAKTKVDITDNKCAPVIDIEFTDGHKLIFKTEHLKTSEILSKLAQFCREKDTSQPESDVALSKMSGKPKKKK